MTSSIASSKKLFSIYKLPGFTFIAITCFVMLYAPIMILVGYSFNEGSSLALWEGFSLRWYYSAWQNEAVKDATLLSLIIALQAALYSTVLATMAALGTTRTRAFRGQTAIYAMINQPLMVPEIVTAVALLIVFATIKQATGYQKKAQYHLRNIHRRRFKYFHSGYIEFSTQKYQQKTSNRRLTRQGKQYQRIFPRAQSPDIPEFIATGFFINYRRVTACFVTLVFNWRRIGTSHLPR